MRATTSATTARIATPMLARIATAIAAALLAFAMAGCTSSDTSGEFLGCDSCGGQFNGGRVTQAECGHWFCTINESCEQARDEHEAGTAECGAAGHWACDIYNHAEASCGVSGHFICDGSEHNVEACTPGEDKSQPDFGNRASTSLPSVSSNSNQNTNAHTHSGGTATCLSKAVCTGCGKAYGSVNPSNHDPSCAYAEGSPCTHECTASSGCVTTRYVPESCDHDCSSDEECGYYCGCDRSSDSYCSDYANDNCPNRYWYCAHADGGHYDCNYTPGYFYNETSCEHAAHDSTCGYAKATACSAD